MSRFLETFAQISFLAIFLRQKRTLQESHRSSPREPLLITAIMSGEFHVGFSSGNVFLQRFQPVRSEEKRGEGEKKGGKSLVPIFCF